MIEPGLCQQVKLDFMTGVHTPSDTYRLALYTVNCEMDCSIRNYTDIDEVRGMGYEPGGVILTGYKAELHGDIACLTFNSAVWPKANIRAAGALLYNASKGNRALCVISFAREEVSRNGQFIVELPPIGENTLLCLR